MQTFTCSVNVSYCIYTGILKNILFFSDKKAVHVAVRAMYLIFLMVGSESYLLRTNLLSSYFLLQR